ncbi:hypothetical protein HWQ46_05130 [Shewanella sp. D64]|uniref:hypothetical protein n=1 Tax=unclassified Shewanella TaxID=196818 RepID=UPI0022BA6F7D|nr:MULTISPECIES: hypothetical protein [unclassified Shewanella]MEC4724934.1 hypothetical protein [Shewanella sp. D64]MEC4736273.1 hypothetical protein [Shewanella sp. E94]WBJ97663.1 hypothetical protein HWQ47_11500 [Shewanella sp. MTB7]
MINHSFEEVLFNRRIIFAQGGEPIKDCVESKSVSPFYRRKKGMKTIASLITSDINDGLYSIQLDIDKYYFIIIKGGLLIQGSDVIVNKSLMNMISDEMKELRKIELTDVLVDEWNCMKNKWVRKNVFTFCFYLLLSSLLLVGVWLTVKVFLL